jgi:hypothetical protein
MRRWLIVLMLIAPAAFAQSFQVSLPLQGYYRVGQYMPVRISGARGEIVIAATGAVPTRIAPGPNQEMVEPLLMMTGNATEVIVTVNGETVKAGPLRVLSPDERIVGVVEGNEAFAATLFPGKKIITVPIDPQFPNPGSNISWDALDAVVLDQRAMTFANAPDEIVVNGTVIAVKSTQKPQTDWPWQQRGDYWVMDMPVYGPTGAEIDPQVYAPSYGLEPEEPLAARQLVLIGATLFAVLVVGSALLLRRRMALVAIVLLCIVASGLAYVALQDNQPAQVYYATVQIRSGQRLQADNWGYMRSWRQPVASPQALNTLVYPMLAGESQIESLQMELRCTPTGAPSTMDVTLPPHNTIAWLRRSVRGNIPKPQLKPIVVKPFEPVLDAKYLSPTLTHVGDELNSGDIVLKPK